MAMLNNQMVPILKEGYKPTYNWGGTTLWLSHPNNSSQIVLLIAM